MHWPPGLRILFLPGLDGTGLSFEPLRAHLPEQSRPVVVKYPLDGYLTVRQLADCAVEQIPREGRFLVVAESFSGPVAIRLLASRRLRAEGAVFCATFAQPPRPLLLRLGKFLPLTTLLRLPLHRIARKTIAGGRHNDDTLKEFFETIRRNVPPQVLAGRIRMLARIDLRSLLYRIAIPCCYLQATHDLLVPPNCIRPFRRALKDLQVVRIDAPHYILQANPPEPASAILAFAHSLHRTS